MSFSRQHDQDVMPGTPCERAQLLIGLAALYPHSVEAAILHPASRRLQPSHPEAIKELLGELYQQLYEDYDAAGAPYGSGVTALGYWIFAISGIPKPLN